MGVLKVTESASQFDTALGDRSNMLMLQKTEGLTWFKVIL